MKWLCTACTQRPTDHHPTPCPDCTGFTTLAAAVRRMTLRAQRRAAA